MGMYGTVYTEFCVIVDIVIKTLKSEKLENSGGISMCFFIDEEQRKKSHGTCYFELQKGRYNGKCWLSDSINIHADLWDEYHLSDLFRHVIKEFAYYGITAVTKQQWNEIVRISQKNDMWKSVIDEADLWVNNCFKEHDVFTILGL